VRALGVSFKGMSLCSGYARRAEEPWTPVVQVFSNCIVEIKDGVLFLDGIKYHDRRYDWLFAPLSRWNSPEEIESRKRFPS
jgi:hypothetical protein